MKKIEDDQNSSKINNEMHDGLIRRNSINIDDDIEISLVKVEEVENSYQQMGNLEIEDIEEQHLRTDKPIRVPISANSLNEEDIVNDEYETSMENFEIEDDQNLINEHDDINDEEIKCEICEKFPKYCYWII